MDGRFEIYLVPGLVDIQKTMENHNVEWVNPTISMAIFSVAMLTYQKVYLNHNFGQSHKATNHSVIYW